MANEQIIDKILNKQFKKTAFAGYETVDVDSFFDTIIDYLKNVDKNIDTYKGQLDKLVKENRDLTIEVARLNQIITQNQNLIARYESEGYGNVMVNKRLAEAEAKIKELEKGKK